MKTTFRVSVCLLVTCAIALAQKSGGVTPGGASFKLLRSVSGSKGSEQSGRYHISDPRSTFYIPEDKNVIVYMEWDGPPGSHTFEAYWRNPAGKVTVVSDFKYELKPREKTFGGYMELMMSDSMATGMWSMEARIDGEVLGVHNFEVVAKTKPVIAEDTRAALGVPELYKRSLAATATVERLDGKNSPRGSGSGFFLEDGSFVTAFQNIDGAAQVRLRLSDSRIIPVHGVLAWNRWQDWAILKTENVDAGRLPKAKNGSWAVGDRCITLQIDNVGSRSIVDSSIIGTQTLPKSGERLKIASSLTSEGIGSPVLNEYGEVVGLVGGINVPGATLMPPLEVGFGYPGNYYSSGLTVNSAAVPISNLPNVGDQVHTFAQLQENRQFIPLVERSPGIGRGTIAKSINRKSPILEPVDEAFAFPHSTGQVVAYILWSPRSKQRSISLLRVFDSENRQVMESKPGKMVFNPGSSFVSTWDIPVGKLATDVYRADIVLDSNVVFRTFFKVTD